MPVANTVINFFVIVSCPNLVDIDLPFSGNRKIEFSIILAKNDPPWA
jgi:hypothetical protein